MRHALNMDLSARTVTPAPHVRIAPAMGISPDVALDGPYANKQCLGDQMCTVPLRRFAWRAILLAQVLPRLLPDIIAFLCKDT